MSTGATHLIYSIQKEDSQKKQPSKNNIRRYYGNQTIIYQERKSMKWKLCCELNYQKTGEYLHTI